MAYTVYRWTDSQSGVKETLNVSAPTEFAARPNSCLPLILDLPSTNDGNGHRDLTRSTPDVLASTANYLKAYGWQKRHPWTEGTQLRSVARMEQERSLFEDRHLLRFVAKWWIKAAEPPLSSRSSAIFFED